MAKYRVAVIGTVGKSVLIDDSLSSRVAKLETQIATVGGVTRHSALLGLQQGDDHPQYTMWQAPETIAAPWNFGVIPFIQGETLAEYIEDVVAGGSDPFIADSLSITWTYDDTGNHLQADVVDEYIEDLVGSMLVNTTYIDLDYGDSDGSIKAILNTGAVLDLVGTAALQDSSTIDFTYDSGTKRTSAAVVQSFSYSWTGNHTFTPASGDTKIHAGNLQLDVDNLELQLGASQDLRLYHDGGNSNIRNDTGALVFRCGATAYGVLSQTGGAQWRGGCQYFGYDTGGFDNVVGVELGVTAGVPIIQAYDRNAGAAVNLALNPFGGRVDVGTTLRLQQYTVATLPTGVQGDTTLVTDATATTFASVVAGGGANIVPVFHDGTNWRIG